MERQFNNVMLMCGQKQNLLEQKPIYGYIGRYYIFKQEYRPLRLRAVAGVLVMDR